jgi:hypothetical protein
VLKALESQSLSRKEIFAAWGRNQKNRRFRFASGLFPLAPDVQAALPLILGLNYVIISSRKGG